MKKLLILLMVLMLAAFVFVACEPGEPDETTDEAVVATTTTAKPVETTASGPIVTTTRGLCPRNGTCNRNPCECSMQMFIVTSSMYHGDGFEYRNGAEQIPFGPSFGTPELRNFLMQNRTARTLTNNVRMQLIVHDGAVRGGTIYNITAFDNSTGTNELGWFRARMTGTDFGIARVGTTYNVQVQFLQGNRVLYRSEIFTLGVDPSDPG
jgi:hypothetical protein